MGEISVIPKSITAVVDNVTLEVSGGKVQIKDDGVVTAKIKDANITTAKVISSGSVFAPIGAIFAWLKSITETPTIPSGWVECDGSTISDPDSVYDGVTIPDLNGSIGNGNKGRFLRGHSVSGLTEDSQNLAHTHTAVYDQDPGTHTSFYRGGNPAGSLSVVNSDGGTEARPFNYSVVYIMRIK